MNTIKEIILNTTENISYKDSIYKEKALKCFNEKDDIFKDICFYNEINNNIFKTDIKDDFDSFFLNYDNLLDIFSMSIHNEINENNDFLVKTINFLRYENINENLLKINSLFLKDFIELNEDDYYIHFELIERLKKHFLENHIIKEIIKDLKTEYEDFNNLMDFYKLQTQI